MRFAAALLALAPSFARAAAEPPLRNEVASLLEEINNYLVRYFRGQFTVSIIDGGQLLAATHRGPQVCRIVRLMSAQ